MSDWQVCKLGDMSTKIGSGSTPRGGSNSYKIEGTSLIRSQNILDLQFTLNGLAFIDDIQAAALKNVTLEPNDILLNITGDSVARVCKVPNDILPARVNQHVAIIRTDINKLLPNFLLYNLIAQKEELLSQSEIGATRKAITKGMIEKFQISLPPLPDQKAIASVLSSLDDKIDLLHRQNKTLEEMAETLFRQWFVEEAEEDWEETELKSLCKVITKGTTPTSLNRSFVESGINFIKVNCIDENGSYLLNKFNFIDEETHNSVLKRSILEEGDILYSIAGTIGRSISVTKDILPANVNQALAIIRVDKEIINPLFVKYSLRDKDITFNLHSKIVHAVQPNLSLGEIGGTLLPVPDDKVLEKLNSIIMPLDSKIIANKVQIRTLEKVRNVLLPKLMSGEIRVEI